MRRDLESVAQRQDEFLREIEPTLRRSALELNLDPTRADAAIKSVEAYLSQIPGTLRKSLRSPEDPSGRTVPIALPLRKADDLRTLLPARAPRFKAGDRPLLGNDLVLEAPLGVGGFGEVWKARHAGRPDAKPVALKFCTDEAPARSLRNEVKLLDRVASNGRHPGIVELKYAHLEADPPCLEYECIEGGDLAGLIAELHRAGRPDFNAIAKIILRLAKAVGFAHRQDPPIVHRDLKPSNILTCREANGRTQLKIADFGIGGLAASQAISEWASENSAAVHTEREPPRGTTSAASAAAMTVSRGTCTPLYASPQQRRFGPPDPRDDVCALGVIWFQAMTGDLTRESPRGGGWRTRFAEKGMSSALVELLEQCLDDDPNDRPQDAQVLADRLTAHLGKPSPAQPEPKEIRPAIIPLPATWVPPPEVRYPPADVSPVIYSRPAAKQPSVPSFSNWYRQKFGGWNLSIQFLVWLLYGFISIPIYYFADRQSFRQKL